MNKAYLILLYFITDSSQLIVYSQNDQFDYIITGSVLNQENEPIKDVKIIVIVAQDSSFINTTITDSTGHFIINNVPKVTVQIQFIHLRYKSVNRDISYDSLLKVVSLNIVMPFIDNVLTEEIVVEKERPVMKFEDDKKVFYVPDNIDKTNTVMDFLRTIPLLEVDFNDNLILQSSFRIKILIDGKDNKSINLKQIPAELIEKIEIITVPSAKYDSEGVTGVINVVLKKSLPLMQSGIFLLKIGTKDKYNWGQDLRIKKNNLTIINSTSIGKYYSNSTSESTNHLNSVYFQTFKGVSTSNNNYFNLSIGSELTFLKNHFIGMWASTNLSQLISKNITDIQSIATVDNSERRSTLKDATSKNDINISYDLKLDSTREYIETSFQLSKSSNTINTNTLNLLYDDSINVSNSPRYSDWKTKITSTFIVLFNYYKNYGNDIKLEAGAKYTLNYILFKEALIANEHGSSYSRSMEDMEFEGKDKTCGLYATLAGKFKTFNFRIGLRLESYKLHNISENILYSKNNINFFPSLNLIYTLDNFTQLQFGYSKRISRPTFLQLIPSKNIYDPRYIYTGNIELKPEIIHMYEAGVLISLNSLTITPLAYLKITDNVISNVTLIKDSNTILSTFKNTNKNTMFGFDLISNYKPNKQITITANTNVSYLSYEHYEKNSNSINTLFWRTNIRMAISLVKLLNLEFTFVYFSRRKLLEGYQSPIYNLNVALNKTLLYGRASISLKVQDLFNTSSIEQATNILNYNSLYKNNLNLRTVYLNFTYRIGEYNKPINKKWTNDIENF